MFRWFGPVVAALISALMLVLPGISAGQAMAVPGAAVVSATTADGSVVSSTAVYTLRSVRVSKRISTAKHHSFVVRATYPQLRGGKAKVRAAFNRAVLAQVQRIYRDQASSIDAIDLPCTGAKLTGGWSGGLVNRRYASILIDWDAGNCGGVPWDSSFGSVTVSLATGNRQSLKSMMKNLGGTASWTAAGTLVRAQARSNCAEYWSSVVPYQPAGWRVTSKSLYLAFWRYQIGAGFCGDHTYRLNWSSYRSAVANR